MYVFIERLSEMAIEGVEEQRLEIGVVDPVVCTQPQNKVRTKARCEGGQQKSG